MDILIVKLGALGDVINTLPLVIHLKNHLHARIHWLVAPLSYPLLSNHPCVDQPILFDLTDANWSWLAVLRQLRSQRFDIVLDLQRILKSGLISLVAGAERKIGFDRRRCKEMSWLLPFERILPSDPTAHMLLQYLEFATFLGIPTTTIEWRIPEGDRLPVWLPPDFVVLNIGATKPANRWTVDGFAALARMVYERHHKPCVLTGGPEDASMAAKIQAMGTVGVFNLVGKTSLPELIDVIAAAAVVVSCDTGPMHLAVALGKPLAALFGPSDERRTGPYRGTVIRAKLDCAPCSRKTCAVPTCMEAIRPEDVLQALDDHL